MKINTWDLFKNAFIQRYSPLFKSTKQHRNKTLYQAWDRYNDLLYKCPTNNLNKQQTVNIFYKGLNIPTKQMLDSQGLIPEMTPT